MLLTGEFKEPYISYQFAKYYCSDKGELLKKNEPSWKTKYNTQGGKTVLKIKLKEKLEKKAKTWALSGNIVECRRGRVELWAGS